MKNKLLIICAGILLFFAACSKDDTAAPAAKVYDVSYSIEGTPGNYVITYTDGYGTSVQTTALSGWSYELKCYANTPLSVSAFPLNDNAQFNVNIFVNNDLFKNNSISGNKFTAISASGKCPSN